MDNNNFNVFNQYLDAQKNMMNMWNNMASQFAPQMSGMNMSNPMEYYKTISDTLANMYTSYTGTPAQMLEKVTQSSEAYYNLYKLWQDIYEKNIEPTEENMNKVMEEWKNKYYEFYTQYMLPYLPAETQNAVKQGMGLTETFKASTEDFWSPWSNSLKDLNEAFVKGAYKDPEAFIKYFSQWKENYNESFGKVLNMPGMGLTRESNEKQLQIFDKYIKLMTYLLEVTVKVNNLINKSSEKTITESFEAIQKGEEPKSFQEFYKGWKANINASFNDLLYSDEFSKLLATLSESVMDLKINLDAVMEKNLGFLPFTKNSDMDSVYKTMYELKKEVRALKKEVAALKEAKAPAKAPAAKAETKVENK